MLQSLVLFAVLPYTAAQTGPLEIYNARATYGYLGATYAKDTPGRLPGDIIYFTFDIKNLKLDDKGRASYSLLVEVEDSRGRPQYKLGPMNSVAQNYLGGNSMPCSAHLEIPVDTPPGDYKFRVTVTDRLANKSATFERIGKVLAPDFGLIQVATYADRESKVPAPTLNVVGASLYVHFAAVNFAREPGSKQPDVHVRLRVLDENGKPTFSKPLSGMVNKNIPEDLKILPLQFALTLNRAGNFTVEIEARCILCKKTVKTTLPLKVVAGP
ncbi:MAG: DUF4625 domain-containing protein [Gemmataceae bacterium]|nr:DUF4625 domain-containing protein [Gemmataceae bacterium]